MPKILKTKCPYHPTDTDRLKIRVIYTWLLKTYKPQGWWPVVENSEHPNHPKDTTFSPCYHPGDYSYPKNIHQQFEICIGAILTQNTAWTNVEMALSNLRTSKLLSPHSILSDQEKKIKNCIRPAGYYNQKYRYIKAFSSFFITLDGKTPTRDSLGSILGIGNETTDSMLLYAYNLPEFVVDTYTKRIFSHIGIIQPKASYRDIKRYFESSMNKNFVVCQEYHALIVKHAKVFYSHKPYGQKDPLLLFLKQSSW